MQILKHAKQLFLATLLGFATLSQAADSQNLDISCDKGVEPGKSANFSSLTKMPAISKQRVLGVWQHEVSSLTLSIVEVNGKYYDVIRSKYCSSGKVGTLLRPGAGGKFYYPDSTVSDYLKIDGKGNLGRYDNAGYIDSYAKRTKLFAD
jgi:hypothetical protein